MYFFPVSVLAALTVTPGSGALPDFTEPVISPNGAKTLVGEGGAGDGGASGWAGWGIGEDCASTGVGVPACANKMLIGARRRTNAGTASRESKLRVREQSSKMYRPSGAPPQISVAYPLLPR